MSADLDMQVRRRLGVPHEAGFAQHAPGGMLQPVN